MTHDVLRTYAPPAVEEGFDTVGSDVCFESEQSAVQRLLPPGFRVPERPVVTVAYRGMLGMRWMGGRDYQAVAVRVAAAWGSDANAPLNPLSLVIWESDCAPIVSGRENLGSPKLFGAIPVAPAGTGEDHDFSCAEYDALLVGAEVRNLAPVGPEAIETAVARARTARSYYWKFPGALDADEGYPTEVQIDTPFVAMWRGEGTLRLEAPDSTAAPYSHGVMRAVSALPQRSAIWTTTWRASDCTLYRSSARRLDQS